MSAIEALRVARDAGILLHVDGVDLVLEASAEPPAAVLELLTRHKAEVIAFIRPGDDGWSPEDWHAFYDERAGIAEFDAGLPRGEAEARAFACCVSEWLTRNPVHSPPDRCVRCGEVEHAQDPLLPFGTGTTGRAWLHSRCWVFWHTARKSDAVSALAKLGIRERNIPA